MKRLNKTIIAFALSLTMAMPVTLPSTLYLQAEGAESNVIGFKNADTTLEIEMSGRFDENIIEAGASIDAIVTNNKYVYALDSKHGQLIVTSLNMLTDKKSCMRDDVGNYAFKQQLEDINKNTNKKYEKLSNIAISPDGFSLAVTVQENDYTENGIVLTYNCLDDGHIEYMNYYNVGVQPNALTFIENNTLLCANRGEASMGYGEDKEDPMGTVTYINLDNSKVESYDFSNFEAETMAEKGVLLSTVDNELVAPKYDFEPECIAISPDKTKAFVSLQRANAIAELDLMNNKFTEIYSCGFEDFSKVPIDVNQDSMYKPSCNTDLLGARMPKGIAVYKDKYTTYIVTANQGSSRKYDNYTNEAQSNYLFANAGPNNMAVIMDSSKVSGLPDNKEVLFGGRNMNIFAVTEKGLEEIYDTGADFENLMAKADLQHFNCSKDNAQVESAAHQYGPAPEKVTVSEMNGRTYAFVTFEGTSGIVAYDVTYPRYSMNVNYINSRTYEEKNSKDVSPEDIITATVDGKSLVLVAYEESATLSSYSLTKKDADGVVVLYTNDVHNAYAKNESCLGYASVAQYKNQLEALGYEVELIDNGDAIQGGVIGTVSKGSYIKEIMGKTGYTIAIPGNHEFDFQMDNFLNLAESAKNDCEYEYISCNFMDLRTGKSVFKPYKMIEYRNKKVAYIGISTPETFTKSTPAYFKDEDGNYIYGFCEGNNGKDLYQKVQQNIDEVREKGADFVVLMSHLGTDKTSSPWSSQDLIANTKGADVLLDGHSHSTIVNELVKNQEGKQVVVSSTGTGLQNLGVLHLRNNGTAKTELVNEISMEELEVYLYVNEITKKFNDLVKSKVAHSDVDLTVNNPNTGKRMVRLRETNLGDLCADAYRELLQADIAFVNGGGVRANIKKGDITYSDIISVHPFGNKACLCEVTGQQVLDALELGARVAPTAECGGFLQVSGITFDIDSTKTSNVILDEKSMFNSVNGEYRVENVKVNGEPLDLNKTYTLASHNYMLKNSGDGFSMFAGSKVLLDEVKEDNQVLIEYIIQKLGGNIDTNSQYADPYGSGRIRIITEKVLPKNGKDGYIKYLKGQEEVTEILPAESVKPTPKPTNSSWDDEHLHQWEKTIAPATMIKNGTEEMVCKTCKEKKTTTIPKIKSVTLDKKSYAYDGKEKTPKVVVKDKTGKVLEEKTDYTLKYDKGRKNVGIYSVSVTFKGKYKGNVTRSFVIYPKATSLIKVVATGKGFELVWKKQASQSTGYQIEYADNKEFLNHSLISVRNNQKTKQTIKKVTSGVKNYVRIRTYQVIIEDGEAKKVYSDWSDVMMVRVK